MTFEDLAKEIVAWARRQVPALREGYPHPGATAGDLPDVVVAIQGVRDVPSDPENFPGVALEQAWLRVFDVELSVMVEQGDDRGAEGRAHAELLEIGETLLGSTAAGTSLGGEVALSARAEIDLADPAHERQDGTRGRALYMRLAAAARLEVR